MKEFTIVGEFRYKDQKYALLLDEEESYFFLKINPKEEYEYITLKELIELTNIFKEKEYVQLVEVVEKKKRKKIRLFPRILLGTLALTLTVSFGSFLNKMNNSKFDLSTPVQTTYTTTISNVEDEAVIEDKTQQAIQRAIEEIARENENFEVEEIIEGRKLQIVLDSSRLDEVLGYPKEDITYDTIRETIQNNENIPDKYKELYILLANNLESQYPGMDLRVWYENLKTMRVEEVDEMQMKLKAISVDAYACYRKDENTIYTVKGYDYVPGTWEYQVIMHEFCHPIRTAFLKRGENEIRIQFENKSGNGVIIGEAMNSLLALRSYDANERDIAYQLQSNMIELMVDSMDNYSYQDFVEHNLTYFENELNIQNQDDRAVEMIGLMILQYKDYHNDEIEVDQSVFHPMYDYIANMYYSKNITSNMTYEEALRVRDQFIDKLTYDVPEEYHLDVEHMNEFFETYCTRLGIQNERTK